MRWPAPIALSLSCGLSVAALAELAAPPASSSAWHQPLAVPASTTVAPAETLVEISPALTGESRELVAQALVHPSLGRARVGLLARSLRTGAVLLRKNPDLLLNPASNAKLVTSAAALTLLGPEYRYATTFASDGEIVDGVLRGHLYVRGSGDPSVTTERLLGVVHELQLLGLSRITGRVIVDDSYFDGQREARGWEQEDSDRAYAAPVGALSLNFNTVTLVVRPAARSGEPAEVQVDPPNANVRLDARVRTSRWRGRMYMKSRAAGDQTAVRLRGRIRLGAQAVKIYRRVNDPALHFGGALAGLLNDGGIRVRRSPRRGVMPDHVHVLVTDRSPRLGRIVSDLNKWSNNFIAEMLVKTLGAEVYGAPGSFDQGLAAIRQFLEGEVGFAPGSYVYGNGSGLNDVNRFSVRQITDLLAYMGRRSEAGAEYVSSLGVAGRQGTIALRFRDSPADRRLRAKTGTLTGVSALSGYVTTASGEPVVFSILVNGYRGSTRPIWEVQDMIGEALALHGKAPSTAVTTARRAEGP